MEQINC